MAVESDEPYDIAQLGDDVIRRGDLGYHSRRLPVVWREVPGLAAHLDGLGICVWQECGEFWTESADAQSAIDAFDGLAEARRQKRAELAAWRYDREVGGIVWRGATIYTDRESRANLVGAVVLAQGTPGATIQWKAANGEFLALDAAGVAALGQAVAAHVAACFDRERALAEEIDALTDWTAVQGFDIAARW